MLDRHLVRPFGMRSVQRSKTECRGSLGKQRIHATRNWNVRAPQIFHCKASSDGLAQRSNLKQCVRRDWIHLIALTKLQCLYMPARRCKANRCALHLVPHQGCMHVIPDCINASPLKPPLGDLPQRLAGVFQLQLRRMVDTRLQLCQQVRPAAPLGGNQKLEAKAFAVARAKGSQLLSHCCHAGKHLCLFLYC